MQDILRIRNELEQFINSNNKNLTSEEIVKKALEAEQKIASLVKN